MVALLAKLFFKQKADPSDPSARGTYGVLCGVAGILLNLLLFVFKLLAGTLSGSIAITSDAFNNLSDAGSSLVTLLGFRLAGQKPDPEHPFGHGRIEYLSGLFVSALILLMGFELLKSAVEKIFHPEAVTFQLLTFVILGVSVLVKLYMVFYNRRYGRILQSEAMAATAMDSLSDSIATAVVMIAMLVSRFTGLNIDGWCGVLVALFILYSGFSSMKSTVAPLLGQPPEPEFVRSVSDIVMSHSEILGIHDLIVHDYGPGRVMVSLHAEVPADGELETMHDAIDNAEHELREKLSCHATIHLDPIRSDDDETNQIRELLKHRVLSVDPHASIHDLRIVIGPTHTNLVFDVVVPFESGKSEEQIRREIDAIAAALSAEEGKEYHAVIDVDRPYVTVE